MRVARLFQKCSPGKRSTVGILLLSSLILWLMFTERPVEKAEEHKMRSGRQPGCSSGAKAGGFPSLNATRVLQRLTLPPRPIGINGVWQSVDTDVEFYLYSAFYDDREGKEKAQVRVIAIADSSVTNSSGVYCLHWFSNQTRPVLAMASLLDIGAYFAPLTFYRQRYYRSVLVSCYVGNTPQFVSVVMWHQRSMRIPRTRVPVQVPQRRTSPLKFGHCLSVLYWHVDPYRLVEWIELHRMWGVAEISVYTSSLHKQTQRVLDYYSKLGVVVLREAPVVFRPVDPTDEDAILLNMSPVLNDCMYRNMYRYHRLVCSDVDEFVAPRTHDNYSAMLSTLEGISEGKVRSYMFTNVYYFSELGTASAEPSYLITPRFLRHVSPSSFGYSVKSITDPRACVGLQNHLCWHHSPETKANEWHHQVPLELGANQHYKACHFDHYLRKPGTCLNMTKISFEDRGMIRFADELERRVLPVLTELDLIERMNEWND